ncbi:hypothetical protein L21SP5_03548 [Salinivirga cyanobacteriivorans]|uniref:Uncharacterized protein n=1 Tax=Salinivirga cyanobacteriivorans TaxID=1307839 RepID=A0A0S2I4L1_9BACT|nr:hypothetical protein L21SP5_03548 [Salinivirga cyanobacteriivorans]
MGVLSGKQDKSVGLVFHLFYQNQRLDFEGF